MGKFLRKLFNGAAVAEPKLVTDLRCQGCKLLVMDQEDGFKCARYSGVESTLLAQPMRSTFIPTLPYPHCKTERGES